MSHNSSLGKMHPLSLSYQSLHAIKSRINWCNRAWSLVSVLRQYWLTTALISTIPARNSLTVKLYRAEQVVIFLPNIEVPRAHVIPCRAKKLIRSQLWCKQVATKWRDCLSHICTYGLTCAAFSVMPQTASARLATDAQKSGVITLLCFVDELIPVSDSANS